MELCSFPFLYLILPTTLKMNLFKQILGRILAVWAILWFVITMFVIILPMLFIGVYKEPKRTKLFRIISKIWMNVYFPIVFCRLKILGREHFKKGENYIVICN